MTVLVHGVPETAELWDRLRAELDAESVAVSLPGFGRPRPDGFAATPDAYADWLAGVGVPVRPGRSRLGRRADLPDRDHPPRAAAVLGRGRRVPAASRRRLARPGPHLADPDAGEAFRDGYLGQPPEAVAAAFEPWGVGHDDALALAAMADVTMAGCVLDLDRAAAPDPHARWQPVRTVVPGLVLDAPADPFGTGQHSEEIAQLLGAEIARLDGLGHWWAPQDPARGAAEPHRFWRSVECSPISVVPWRRPPE